MKTIYLKIQVRTNGDYLEAFFYDPDNGLSCFSFREGHNQSSNDYRLRVCKPVDKLEASIFRNKMQKHYDITDQFDGVHVNLILVDKLTKA